MKKARLVIGSLILSLVVFTSAAIERSVNAELCCSDLKGCSGGACCSNGGDKLGCTINCSGGGTIVCGGTEESD